MRSASLYLPISPRRCAALPYISLYLPPRPIRGLGRAGRTAVWSHLPYGLTSRARPPRRLFTAEYTAGMLLDVLEGLAPEDSGGFFAYDGSAIPW